jgi:transcriptional regulator with XRE-family HTH domain
MSDYQRNRALIKAIIDDGRQHGQIAAAVRVSRVTFSGVCSGRVRPSASLRARIAAELGRPEHELFDVSQVSA